MKKCIIVLVLLLSVCLVLVVSCKTTSNSLSTTESSNPAGMFDSSLRDDKLSIFFIATTKSTPTTSPVDAGDAVLLISPDGKTMLIDTSNYYCADEIITFLKNLRITELDYLVFSHPHSDHIGGASAILKEFKVGQIIDNGLACNTNTYENLYQQLEQKKLPVTSLVKGDSFKFGDFVDVVCFNPPVDYPNDDFQIPTVNNGSMVLKFSFGEFTYLTCGDLYGTQEQVIVAEFGSELDSDLIKVNHHGYNTSSGLSFLKTVTPSLAVIEFNSDELVIFNRLNNLKTTTLHTHLDGSVAVFANTEGFVDVFLSQPRTSYSYVNFTPDNLHFSMNL